MFFPFSIESLLTVAEDGAKWFHAGEYHVVIGSQRMFTINLHGPSTLWQRFK